MMSNILLVFAFVLLTCAAFLHTNLPKIQIGWLGLACWVFSILLH